MHITRRKFGASALAFGAGARSLVAATNPIRDVLRTGIASRKIPCVAAMVASSRKILFEDAFGTRDATSGMNIKIDSIFSIASMTKAITTTAAMQLVELGKVKLEEPVYKYLPQLSGVGVLTGYDEAGKPLLRPPARPITLHHLLTHTSGLCYSVWDAEMTRYGQRTGGVIPPNVVAPVTPLMFDPGTRWQYGTGIDFAGKLVEAVSGMSLEDYFQKNILGPLEMTDTSFILPPAKFERLVTGYGRQPDGTLKPNPREQPPPPTEFNGGGGLFSTCGDYTKFMQMILRYGTRSGSSSTGQVLTAKSVQMMMTNQTGSVPAGVLKTSNPVVSSDMDLNPGASDRYTFGFLMNPEPYADGRSAGSLAWAGIFNTYYWIDPARDRCAVIMMQFLPFVDKEAVGLLADFQKAVYASS